MSNIKDLQDSIIEILSQKKDTPFLKEELVTFLLSKFDNYIKDEIENTIHEMINQYLLHESRNGRIDLLSRSGLFIGKINIKEKGYGFIQTDDMEEYYVAKEDTNHAMNQDKVLFRKLKSYVLEGKNEAIVVKIIERNMKQIVGRIYEYLDYKMFKPIDKSITIKIEVTDFGLSVNDDIVVVKIDKYVHDDYAIGHVEKIIGNKNDVGIDIKTIAMEYGFEQEFPKSVIDNIELVNNDYLKNINDELKRRKLLLMVVMLKI